MSKHAAALQKALPGVDLFAAGLPSGPMAARTPANRAHAELAVRVFRETAKRSIVAFTSLNRGAGVTTTVTEVAGELIRSGNRVAILDGTLRHRTGPWTGLPDPVNLDTLPNRVVPSAKDESPSALDALRSRYDCVLLDCGALSDSVDLLRIAPMTDGVVIVVEAERTTKPEIDRAIQLIQEVGGNLLGFVFNKRRYPIPRWLYRFL